MPGTAQRDAGRAAPGPIDRWILAATAVLAAAGLVVIWAPPVLPGLDTPHNLVAVWIAAHPGQYAGWFEPNWPIGLLAHRAVLEAAVLVAPPFVALKLARTAELLLMVLGSLALVRRVGAAAGVVLPLCLSACFGWFHLMGYLNFTFAAALVPGALACVGGGVPRRTGLLLALLLLLVTESHPFVGAGLASILAVAALCHRAFDRPAAPLSFRAVFLSALLSLAVVAVTVLTAAPGQPAIEARSVRPTTLVEDLAALPHTVFGGYSPLGAPLAALGVLAAGLWLWTERRARTLRWWVGLLSLAAIVGYFAAPLDGVGWLFLKPRFALFPFLVAPLLVRLPPRLGRGLAVLAFALAGAHLAFFGVRSVAAGRRTAETIAAFGRAPPGVMLPVVMDGRDGQEPPGNLGTLTYTYAYALLNGPGAAPLLFAQNPGLHHVLLAEGARIRVPQRPSPWAYRTLSGWDPVTARRRRDKLLDRAAVSACAVDSVVLIGATPDDRARLEARGIRLTSPGFGRPACAQGTLRIDGAARAPVRLRVGFAATGIWAVDRIIDPSGATLTLQLPAGDVDVLLCAPASAECAPGSRALVARRLVLAPGGRFSEALAAP